MKKQRSDALLNGLLKAVFPTQIIIFIIVMALFYQSFPTMTLMGITAIGIIPSFILIVRYKNYMFKNQRGRRVYNQSVAYLLTAFVAFAYLWLLMRSNEFGLITKIIAAPAIMLIYYATYTNLQNNR